MIPAPWRNISIRNGVFPNTITLKLRGLNLNVIYAYLLREYLPEDQPQREDLGETIALKKERETDGFLCNTGEEDKNR